MSSHDDMLSRNAELQELIARHITEVPFNATLGIAYARSGNGWLENTLNWRDGLQARTDADIFSTGSIVSLIDATCGAAVLFATERVTVPVTVNLQVDHLRTAHRDQRLTARAECIHITRQFVFVNATVGDDDTDSPVAIGSATFMI